MRITNSFIERVLSGDATPEEKKELAAFFRDHPGKLAQYMTEESWLNFNDETDTSQDARPMEIPSQKIREALEERIGKMDAPDHNHRILSRLVRITAAAAFVGAAGLALFYWTKNSPDKGGQTHMVAGTHPDTTQPTRRMEAIRNAANRPKLFSLPDGSTVKLAALSELSYDQTFPDHKRDFFLQGEGTFTVKKDPLRPFIVHSQGIATTALGTVFSVDDRGHSFSIVHLYSGRVVVRKETPKDRNAPKDSSAQNTALANAFKDVYLVPGQQLILNKGNYTARISIPDSNQRKTELAAHQLKNDYPKQLQFTREPLPGIFSQLQKAYGVTISYDSTRMKNMDFTGLFNHDKETLDSFLGVLCDLNGLTLIKRKADHFLIREN